VVALDGPSGTGKSTVARRLAQRLGARYLDTGAMYRAATLAVLRAQVSLDDPGAISKAGAAADISISTDPASPGITLDGDAVDAEIRSARVTSAVSAVSAVPAVREQLVALQREIISSGKGAGGIRDAQGIVGIVGIVVEGRDIGSVVWPQARPKVYLTASAEARAQRRAGELGGGVDVAAVAADIARRDRLDSTRAASPLARADSAVLLDTTELGIDEVVQRLVDMTMVQAQDGQHDD